MLARVDGVRVVLRTGGVGSQREPLVVVVQLTGPQPQVPDPTVLAEVVVADDRDEDPTVPGVPVDVERLGEG